MLTFILMRKKGEYIENPNSRSTCPIANTLDIVGDKWTLLIIRDILRGKSKYGEFASSVEGIPTNILAARLRTLEENGLVRKRPYSKKPLRFEYLLTKAGRRLEGLVKMIRDWGFENLSPDALKNGE